MDTTSGGRVTAAEPEPRYVYDPANAVDPLGDAELEIKNAAKLNRAKVGSARPS